MNPLPECCFPHSAPIPHQFVMKVYVDAWIYVTEKFVNMGNIELYEGVLRYEKTDYPPIPNFIFLHISFIIVVFCYRIWGFTPILPPFSRFTPFSHYQLPQKDARRSALNHQKHGRICPSSS